MKAFFCGLLIFPLVVIAQQNGFIIDGALTGIKENSIVVLVNANKPLDTLAKSTVLKGKFILKGKLEEPGLYNLNFSGLQKQALLFLDNSKIVINGDSAQIQKINVEGSGSHKDFQELQLTFDPLFLKFYELSDQMKMGGRSDSLRTEINKISVSIQSAADKFVLQKKQSYVTPLLVLVTAQLSGIETVERRYASLTPNIQASFYGKLIQEMVSNSKLGEVGSNAIDFIQNDPDGKPVSLSSFKGKYVLVDFWASWCGPCRQENPNVVNTYNTFKDKNFTVLGVSLDRSRESWLKAIREDNLTWTHVSDLKFWSNEVAVKYKIGSIPQNFLIDPSGKIIARNLRGSDLPQRLADLLK